MKKPRTITISAMAALALVLLVSSCEGGGDRVRVIPAPTDTGASPEPVTTLRAFANLTFHQPVFLTWLPPAGDRLVVLEQKGKIVSFPNNDNARQTDPFLDITGRVRSDDNEGLLGLAFDPAFAQNGFFYVFYTAAAPRRAVVSRFSVAPGDPVKADPTSEKVVLQIPLPPDRDSHVGGGLAYGGDGKLYVSMGDGGGSGDPDGNAQNLGNLLGKILRIDPAAGDPYAVPPDNPFTARLGARPEIWAYGFSNPYRISFDPARGDLWAGDNGRDQREEIDLVVRGGNYGWNVYEGNQRLDNAENQQLDSPANQQLDSPANQLPKQFQPPVIDYGSESGRSVIGGYVYHGSLARSLSGTYIYGDYYSGKIWSLIYRDGEVALNEQIARIPGISSFGLDKNGELFALSVSNNQIYRFNELP